MWGTLRMRNIGLVDRSAHRGRKHILANHITFLNP